MVMISKHGKPMGRRPTGTPEERAARRKAARKAFDALRPERRRNADAKRLGREVAPRPVSVQPTVRKRRPLEEPASSRPSGKQAETVEQFQAQGGVVEVIASTTQPHVGYPRPSFRRGGRPEG